MWINKLKLHHFRNYGEKEFEFGNKINLVLGPNGSGKTSLLESIYLLSLGKSFRTNQDQTLLSMDQQDLFIKGSFFSQEGIEWDILYGFGKKKMIKINQKTCMRLSDLIGLVNVILFLDKDIGLMEGPPGLRRRFMDVLFSQVDKNYLLHLIHFQKVLQQRNFYLKTNSLDEVLRESLNQNLVRYGSEIVSLRKKYFQDLISCLKETEAEFGVVLFQDLMHEYECSVLLPSHESIQMDQNSLREYFLKALLESRPREERLKYTWIGPHRDDWLIFKGRRLKFSDFSSTGEKRLFVLLLKIAELKFIMHYSQEPAIILMDDIILELDENNKKLIFTFLKTVTNQVFIASVDENDYKILDQAERILL